MAIFLKGIRRLGKREEDIEVDIEKIGGSSVPVSVPVKLSTDDWLRITGGLAGTGFSPEEKLNPANASYLSETFGLNIGYVVISQPAVKNGVVYFGDSGGYCYAYSVSGIELWSTYLSSASGGIAGSPAVEDVVLPDDLSSTTLVFLAAGGDDTSDQCYLFALNAWDGTIVWQTPLGSPPGAHCYSSAAVFDGSVYIGYSSVDDNPLVQSEIVKLDAITGEIQSSFKIVPDGKTGGGVWGSVTIDEDERTLYFASGNGEDSPSQDYGISVVKLNADTLEYIDHWQNPVVGDEDFGSTPTLFEGTVTIDGSNRKLVGVGCKDGNYYIFDRNDLSGGPVKTIQFSPSSPNGQTGLIAPASYNGEQLVIAGPSHDPISATLITNLGIPNADLRYTAKTTGLDGQQVSVAYDITGGDIIVTTIATAIGHAITVLLKNDGETIQATADDVLSAIEADPYSDALVIVEHAPENDGSGIVDTYGPMNLSGGSVGHVAAYNPNDLTDPIWDKPVAQWPLGPVISTPYLVFVSSDGIYVFRATDGFQLIKLGSGGPLYGGASLAGHVLYFGDPQNNLVYGYSVI